MPQLIRRLTDQQQGSSLVAILGIAAVIIIIGLLVTTATLQAFTTTGQTRDSVDASAAAEAGAAVAHTSVDNETCSATGGRFSSDSAPHYRAVVMSAAPGGNYTPGCPTSEQSALIVSTGYADAQGFQQRSGTQRHVEVELDVPETASGGQAAVLSFNSTIGGGGQLSRYDPEVRADMVILEGDFVCDGGGFTEGSVVVAEGGMLAAAGCDVRGDVWILEDGVTCPAQWGNRPNPAMAFCTSGGAQISGDVVAPSANVSTLIGGSLYTSGDTYSHWGAGTGGDLVVGGDFHYHGANNYQGNAWVRGHSALRQWNVNISGSLHTGSFDYVGGGQPSVGGDVVVGGAFSGPAAPPAPAVIGWPDIGYSPAQWPGRTTVQMSGTCDFNALRSAVEEIGNRAGIIDARNCNNGLRSGGGQHVTIQDELVIFAEEFQLDGGSTIRGPSGTELHLIQPDNTADGRPTCDYGNRGFNLGGGFRFGPTGSNNPDQWLKVGVYTPCPVEWGSDARIRGQVVAGNINMHNGGEIHHDPVSWPGISSNGGSSESSTSPREILQYRDSPRSAEDHF